MNLDNIQNQSDEVRTMFREIERQPWGSHQYAIELIVQTGHLADIILRQSHKLNNLSIEDNIRIVGDELADIILNLYSICLEEDIEVNFDLMTFKPDNITDVLEAFVLLSKSINILASYIFESRDYETDVIQKLLIRSFQLTLNLINYFKIDMNKAFENMVEESKIFVSKHKK